METINFNKKGSAGSVWGLSLFKHIVKQNFVAF